MAHLNVSIVTKYTNKAGEAKSRWNKVGAAFENKIGGYNVILDMPIVVVPGQSELVISLPKEESI